MSKQDVALQVLQQVVKLLLSKLIGQNFSKINFPNYWIQKDIPRLLEGPNSLIVSKDALDKLPILVSKDNVLLISVLL